MLLGTIPLPNARIVSNKCDIDQTVHKYLFSNLSKIERKGIGPRHIEVEGYTETVAMRDGIEAACEVATEYKFYFESALGLTVPDRYYKVKVDPLDLTVENASVYGYKLTMTCEDPRQYYVATNTVIW